MAGSTAKSTRRGNCSRHEGRRYHQLAGVDASRPSCRAGTRGAPPFDVIFVNLMTSSSKHDRRPTLACEIAADRVLAGRAADKGRMVETAATRELAPGTVVPDLMEANLRDGKAIRQAIESALGSVGARSRDVIAILPDTSVRVVLLDFETLPEKGRRPRWE